MAENIPPSTSTTTGPSSSDAKPTNGITSNEAAARGLPYYEKLRRDLRDTIQKKRILDKNLSTLEDTIHRYETTYLEETSPAGNIIKGFDNYIKGSAITGSSGNLSGTGSGTISGSALGGAGAASRKKALIIDSDRVFSRSSVGSNVKTEVAGEGAAGGADSPATAGTPTATTATGGGGVTEKKGNKKGGNKKKTHAAAVADDEGGSSAAEAVTTGTKKNKRLKVSYGRD